MTQPITAELVRQLAAPRAHQSVWESRENAIRGFLSAHPRSTRGAFTTAHKGSGAWFLPAILGLLEKDEVIYEMDYGARGGDAIRWSARPSPQIPFPPPSTPEEA
jgi:hypothetical protein